MKSLKLLFLLLAVIVLSDCSHRMALNAEPSLQQVSDHKGIITSELKHSVSLFANDVILSKHSNTMFTIIVENRGERLIHISEDNISVIFEGKSREWASKRLDIVSPIDAAYALAPTPRSRYPNSNTGATGEKVNITKNTSTDISPSPLVKNRDIIRMMQETANNSAKLEFLSLREKKDELFRVQSAYSFPRILLTPQDIKPHDSITAVFLCDTREMDDDLKGNFIITVFIDGEEHKFIFKRIYL